jgi:hypothetical protein
MWLERFVIVITSLHRDYLPSSWGILPDGSTGDLHRHDRVFAALFFPSSGSPMISTRDADVVPEAEPAKEAEP